VLGLVTAACAAPSAALGPAPVRSVEVALVGPFSGPDGSAGDALRNSLELQARAIDAGGGLLGARVEIVAADGAGDPARAAELVREQVGAGGVALVVGPDTTAGFQAARRYLDQAGVPNCLTAVADDALRGARTTFLVGPAQDVEVAALLGALRRARPDVRRIGLLDAGDDLGSSYDAQLAAQAPGAGLGYVGHAPVSAGADPRAALAHLAAMGAQVVVVSQPAEAAAGVAAAAAQLGASRPLLAGFAAAADYGFPSLGGDAAAGAILVSTPQPYLAGAPRARWPAGYRAFVDAAGQQYGFGSEGSQLQAAPAAADCLLQWSRAVRAAGTFAGAAVAGAWEQLSLPASATALGVPEHVSPTDHTAVAQDALVAYTWTRAGSRYQLRPV
jgi:branched-chain amino acid transport system substrate-binding protein